MNTHLLARSDTLNSTQTGWPTPLKRIVLAAVLLFGVLGTVRAAVVVVGPTASNAGSLTITQDITFTITTGVTGGDVNFFFVLDEWVISDGGRDLATIPPLLISLNGGAPRTYGSIGSFGGEIVDNFTGDLGFLTPDDGYFYYFGSPNLKTGDTVTLEAATYPIAPVSGFNPQATQTFTGNLFMATSNGPFSNTVAAAPEPVSGAFLAMGGLPLFVRRRRRRR
jgi:hypothetical protein